MEYDLYQELLSKTKQLEISVRQLRKSGTDAADAEEKYKIILCQTCLKLRDEGMPVTLIDKCCYGIPAVAEARFKRDVAKVVLEANQESINSIKLQMRLIENQIGREWGIAGKGGL
jgi:hypothetical protein